jgi:hypothetical protein
MTRKKSGILKRFLKEKIFFFVFRAVFRKNKKVGIKNAVI